jgi:hypothetical protein
MRSVRSTCVKFENPFTTISGKKKVIFIVSKEISVKQINDHILQGLKANVEYNHRVLL